METNQEGNAEKFFKEFGKKLDQFFVEAKDASTRVESDFKQKFEELKSAGEKLKAEIENKERWKEVETSLKKAGEEFEKAMRAAFTKRNSPS
jgi:phosphoglycerate-specific signal transduction histidine kinase